MSNNKTYTTYFLDLLGPIASKSKDPNTKTGAIITGPDNEIRSTGFNGFPRGIDFDNPTSSRWAKPEKYIWAEHAERNAIYNAARMGNPTNNCFLYCSHFPCVECARAIIQSGIKKVILPSDNILAFRDVRSVYYEDELHTRQMFLEAGVIFCIANKIDDQYILDLDN